MSVLAIIAGGGPIPVMLAEHCQKEQRRFVIFAVRGAASADIERFPHTWINLGTIGKTVRQMRRAGCEQVVLIGGVKRPRFRELRLDFGAIRLLPAYLRATRGGDDQLLRFPVHMFEGHGFVVVAAEEVRPDLAAPAGVLGALSPGKADWSDISQGAESAHEIGRRDIGQGAIVRDGVVLAREEADGTDAMLHRCAALPGSHPGLRRGVLVKRCKPQQDRRIDLPTIGVLTVENAANAGLAGIAVDAGGALIVDTPQVVAAADTAGLFIVGLEPEQFTATGIDAGGA